jgi:histidine ammonia-lyase
MAKLTITGAGLDLATIYQFATAPIDWAPTVTVSQTALKKVARCYDFVQTLSRGEAAIYGVNTGFGLLSDVRIARDKLAELQVNLLRSHACGVGNPLSEPEVRAALLLRANTLVQGASGVSPQLIKSLLALLNKGVTPWVPEQGSVGASGDLAPLAHLALVLIGEGKAYYKGQLWPGAIALKKAGLKPYSLQAKEGLALINGTQIMTAISCLVVYEALQIAKHADIVGAMTLEATRGTKAAFDTFVHQLRPHPTQIKVAANLRKLLANSEIAKSHKDCGKVQDPYSLRCMPQVHGASRVFLQNAVPILEIEMNSVTDNPIVRLPKGKEKGQIISGGNFHGEFIAQAMDGVAISLAEIANISDLRMQKLVNPTMSGLPAFLTPDPGLNSGMMIVQVCAASLVSENKILCHPASVDSIPTSADKEDHVSMGVTAARKARQVLNHTRKVLAMEFLCAAQGLDFLQPLRAGKGAQIAFEVIRKHIKTANVDRAFHQDIENIELLIKENIILKAIEQKVGSL